MLSAHGEKRKTSLIELQEQLQQLPGLIADLESTTANLTHLETSFEVVENHLLNLEDLCAQCELESYKHTQSQQLENYKENKRLINCKDWLCPLTSDCLEDQSAVLGPTTKSKIYFIKSLANYTFVFVDKLRTLS
ncbi:dysbindin-like [Molossus nigricans]